MSQDKAILEYLKTGKRITPMDALKEFGCFRLSARIYNLKQEGHEIMTHRVTKGKKSWAEYQLIKEKV